MRAGEPSSPADVVGIGLAFAGAGLYFVLVGFGVLPTPGEAKGPPFVIVGAGLAFLLAGSVCLLRAGPTDRQSELPENAPRRMRHSCRVAAVAIAGLLATIGTWIAIGSGPRGVIASAPFSEMSTAGETLGRTVFGLVAVIVWICAIALAVGAVRRLFGAVPVTPAEPGEHRNP